MPRSSNVYVVCLNGSNRPVAAFTVKYELEGWLEKQVIPTVYHIWRFRDCKGRDGATMFDLDVQPNDN